MADEKEEEKKQPIRMRRQGHPVTFDGNVTYMNDDGDFDVEFDGPVNKQMFRVRSETLVVSLNTGNLWEVMP